MAHLLSWITSTPAVTVDTATIIKVKGFRDLFHGLKEQLCGELLIYGEPDGALEGGVGFDDKLK